MKTNRTFRIFMIDDDEMFSKALQHHIQENMKETVDIRLFPTGEEFLKNFPLIKPDLVIVDHILNSRFPHAMDGRSVLQKIRQSDQRIPVIMLSGQNKIEVALDTIKNGANDYVVKNDNAFLKVLNIIKGSVKENSQKHWFYEGWTAVTVSAIAFATLSVMIYKIFIA